MPIRTLKCGARSLFYLAALFGVLLIGCVRHSEDTMVADERTRALARSIPVNDVNALLFYGVQLKCWENDPIKVTDRAQIARFVSALQQAQTRPLGLANRVNTLQIVFRPGDKQQRKPTTLDFNTTSAADCFGPEFKQALESLPDREWKR